MQNFFSNNNEDDEEKQLIQLTNTIFKTVSKLLRIGSDISESDISDSVWNTVHKLVKIASEQNKLLLQFPAILAYFVYNFLKNIDLDRIDDINKKLDDIQLLIQRKNLQGLSFNTIKQMLKQELQERKLRRNRPNKGEKQQEQQKQSGNKQGEEGENQQGEESENKESQEQEEQELGQEGQEGSEQENGEEQGEQEGGEGNEGEQQGVEEGEMQQGEEEGEGEEGETERSQSGEESEQEEGNAQEGEESESEGSQSGEQGGEEQLGEEEGEQSENEGQNSEGQEGQNTGEEGKTEGSQSEEESVEAQNGEEGQESGEQKNGEEQSGNEGEQEGEESQSEEEGEGEGEQGGGNEESEGGEEEEGSEGGKHEGQNGEESEQEEVEESESEGSQNGEQESEGESQEGEQGGGGESEGDEEGVEQEGGEGEGSESTQGQNSEQGGEGSEGEGQEVEDIFEDLEDNIDEESLILDQLEESLQKSLTALSVGKGSGGGMLKEANPRILELLERANRILALANQVDLEYSNRGVKDQGGVMKGITTGNNVKHMFKSQLLLPDEIFLERYTNRALLQRAVENEGVGDFYFLIDKSGSMRSTMPNGYTAFENVSAVALASAMEAEKNNKKVFVQYFDYSSTEPLDVNNVFEIAEVEAGGGTDMMDALKRFMDYYNNYPGLKDVRQIFIMSDFETNYDRFTLEEFKNFARNNNLVVTCIHVYGDDEVPDNMQYIIDQICDEYYKFNNYDASELFSAVYSKV